MKPTHFTYHAPGSLAEAIRLLQALGDDAKALAGGQSLVPMMNFRLARPAHLIDLERISDLRYIRSEGGTLRVGALTTHAEIEASPVFQSQCPLAVAAAGYIGHAAIRNRGTIGGSLAHADPAAEWPLVLTCLAGAVVVEGAQGRRTVPARNFFLGYLTTALLPGELVVEVEFPVPQPTAGWSFQEVARRHGDFAIVAAASSLTLDSSGRIATAALAVGGASPVPVVIEEVSRLIGERPTATVLRKVADAAAQTLEPEGDQHATAEYRRETAVVLARRALSEAVIRAGSSLQTDRLAE